MTECGAQLLRLMEVVEQLRAKCPWDAQQTHRSLVTYLVEETAEVVDAIEAGSADDLREELGDLLLQVYFHAQIASETEGFTLDDVAAAICDKLVRRHPHVFGDEDAPDDLDATWEARKRAEKGRTSALDGIPQSLDTLARTAKVVHRSRKHGVELGLSEQPITAADFGTELVALVARAQASGIDPDQATRDALRALEDDIRRAEQDA